MSGKLTLLTGDCADCLRRLTAQSAQVVVTSPPYWGLRDYGVDGQIGLEETPDEYVSRMVEVFREIRRVLTNDGTLWLNLGDSYAANGRQEANSGLARLADKYAPRVNKRNPNRDDNGSVPRAVRKVPPGLKAKDLIGVPWRVAFALQADGWYLRQDIIWHKPNPMPESVTDRCTRAHEYIFMFSKSPRYFYDHEAIKEPAVSTAPSGKGFKRPERLGSNARGQDAPWSNVGGTRNRRSVWTVTTKAFKGAHFATFPPDLIEPCILAGSKPGDVVLDPFNGAGTTGLVALKHGRRYIGIDLNPEYIEITEKRLAGHVKDEETVA